MEIESSFKVNKALKYKHKGKEYSNLCDLPDEAKAALSNSREPAGNQLPQSGLGLISPVSHRTPLFLKMTVSFIGLILSLLGIVFLLKTLNYPGHTASHVFTCSFMIVAGAGLTARRKWSRYMAFPVFALLILTFYLALQGVPPSAAAVYGRSVLYGSIVSIIYLLLPPVNGVFK